MKIIDSQFFFLSILVYTKTLTVKLSDHKMGIRVHKVESKAKF